MLFLICDSYMIVANLKWWRTRNWCLHVLHVGDHFKLFTINWASLILLGLPPQDVHPHPKTKDTSSLGVLKPRLESSMKEPSHWQHASYTCLLIGVQTPHDHVNLRDWSFYQAHNASMAPCLDPMWIVYDKLSLLWWHFGQKSKLCHRGRYVDP